ncbi:MAG: bifunctional diaminohydroxyphosphoribosylaminopyrimidine deaminase/5-amino-6-(5-phosphoribosylamino)uracil reductase RibD [Prevotellaceae bacterium]|nr:bifunctional diaminohydroxyphosphoribosylaminopyrimidine deaminase/5-amino-6-(5-phosphoribosylamino)uracil reductase RibD [Prevotellaceae bacterium]
MSTHEKYMRRCLDVARNGFGRVAPNPMVGAALVRGSRIISEGYHRGYGLAHAEVEAIGKVQSKDLLLGCTLYVSLEPCCHFGKTPPCTELIIASNISRVVVAAADPFPKVNGGGIQRLREAGVEVIVGVLEQEARELNRRFFTFHEKKRPYIILKWAQSADGFIDACRAASEPPAKISGLQAHRLSHKWRTEEQAIMAGANTALMDNPRLTARLWSGKNPIRVVQDRSNGLPRTLNVFSEEAPTVVLNGSDARGWMDELYGRGVQSVIVEGGAKLLQRFIEASLWDEARIFTSPCKLLRGVAAPRISGAAQRETSVGDDLLQVLSPVRGTISIEERVSFFSYPHRGVNS